jgi:dihydrofolate reductase
MSEIIMIAAVAANNVIGKGLQIPWYIKADFAHFKKLTLGHTVIMGERTWQSLPGKPLVGRRNIVLSFDPNCKAEGAEIKFSLEDALKACADSKKVFLIGGASVYKAGMEIADTLEITLLHREFKGDVFFPEIDKDIWQETARTERTDPEYGDYSFVTYVRKTSGRR